MHAGNYMLLANLGEKQAKEMRYHQTGHSFNISVFNEKSYSMNKLAAEYN